MSIERAEIIEKYFRKEFPEHVRSFCDEFLVKYPKKYQPLGEVEVDGTKKTLFKLVEDYISENYKTKYSVHNDFEFYASTAYSYNVNFGIELGRFQNKYQGTDKLSKIVKEKVSQDVEIECELIKLRLRSYLKRFFIQGGVDWYWIVADQIFNYGVDKFPNSLDHELNNLEYSMDFFERSGHLGELKGVPWNETEIYKREKEFYDNLKTKASSEYNYLDILQQGGLYLDYAAGKVIRAKCNSLKDIPLVIIYKPERKHPDERFYKFPYRFKINIDEVITVPALLQEYLETFNEPENEIRKYFGLPLIGEGWISETNLYYEIKSHFNTELVVHHGRPKWLGKQHLDIFFPKLNIGIEFQGDQHYYPIEFFGGEESFLNNKRRDAVKKQLCQDNNCHLIYVNPGYKISDVVIQISEAIRKRI